MPSEVIKSAPAPGQCINLKRSPIMKIAPTSRCKIFLSILIHFSNVVVLSYYNNKENCGKEKEKKVGMRGLLYAIEESTSY
jgi:hypothetical protein